MITEPCSAWHASIKITLTKFEAEKLLTGLRKDNAVSMCLRDKIEKFLRGGQP